MSGTSGRLVLRVQSREGRLLLHSLSPESTLYSLQKALQEKTNIHPNSQKILFGYPPKEILTYKPLVTLHSLSMKSGETIIVEELSEPREWEAGGGSTVPAVTVKTPMTAQLGDHTRLTRKVVPADNSCLFKSISILLGDGRESSGDLRELAAGLILSNPDKYSTAVLGKRNTQYVDWLLREQSWGGAIELSVFSEHYQVELDVVDIQTQRIDRFGGERDYLRRALLIYDGIHYDPLVMEEAEGTVIQRVFPTDSDAVLVRALEIAKDAYDARQYTDMNRFTLRCLVCGVALTGQEDAQDHARATGHINFGEV